MSETLPPALPLDVIEPETMQRRLDVIGALPETGLEPGQTIAIIVALLLLNVGLALVLYRRRPMEGSDA